MSLPINPPPEAEMDMRVEVFLKIPFEEVITVPDKGVAYIHEEVEAEINKFVDWIRRRLDTDVILLSSVVKHLEVVREY